MRRDLQRRLEALERRDTLVVGDLRVIKLYETSDEEITGLTALGFYAREPGESMHALCQRIRAMEPHSFIAIAEYPERFLEGEDESTRAARVAIVVRSTLPSRPNLTLFKRSEATNAS